MKTPALLMLVGLLVFAGGGLVLTASLGCSEDKQSDVTCDVGLELERLTREVSALRAALAQRELPAPARAEMGSQACACDHQNVERREALDAPTTSSPASSLPTAAEARGDDRDLADLLASRTRPPELISRLVAQSEEERTRTYQLRSLRHVLESCGPPDGISASPQGELLLFYRDPQSEQQVCFSLLDGLVIRVSG